MKTRASHIKAIKRDMEWNSEWWKSTIITNKDVLNSYVDLHISDPDGVYRLFSKEEILGLWESVYPTTPKVETKVEKKADTVNVEALMTSINNLRTRNSELVSKVGKMKNEIKSANDEIASLEMMLALANARIASLEKDNEELAIYKEMVEEETKIAA